MKLARLLAAVLLLTAGAVAARAAGDTGTYEILDYRVMLTPHANGKVDIAYAQRWRVTGGHIPWITVGLPNENFAVMRWGDAARSISPANYPGWSGVRIDLDRDYQSGQTFAITFSVSQDKLFYAKGEDYRLDFTPGWYDRARIDSLEVRLRSFAKTETIIANPQPASISGDELLWTKAGLREGERFSVSISFPKSAAPGALPQSSLRSSGGAPKPRGTPVSGEYLGAMIGSIILLLLIIYGIYGYLRNVLSGNYSGGGIFYGGGPGSGRGGGGGHPRHTGGGGGFGGSGFSCVCACACVSCACACACAGGGGAGCSRKREHRCASCGESILLRSPDDGELRRTWGSNGQVVGDR